MTTATPAKLRDGTWGARVAGRARAGDTVTITTRAGKSWTATITRIVWSGEGVTLCATGTAPRSRSRRSRGTWTGCSCGSIEEYTRDSDCATCQHDA